MKLQFSSFYLQKSFFLILRAVRNYVIKLKILCHFPASFLFQSVSLTSLFFVLILTAQLHYKFKSRCNVHNFDAFFSSIFEAGRKKDRKEGMSEGVIVTRGGWVWVKMMKVKVRVGECT